MPDRATLHANAREKLEDAQALFDRQRYDGAAYICGYAVEFALKSRICETLDTDPYPEKYQTYKTHDFETLLLLSGLKKFISNDTYRSTIWSTATRQWKPEMRYQAAGAFSKTATFMIIKATEELLRLL